MGHKEEGKSVQDYKSSPLDVSFSARLRPSSNAPQHSSEVTIPKDLVEKFRLEEGKRYAFTIKVEVVR